MEDDYRAYLVSKDRYKYLIGKNIEVSKIEYLSRASYVCAKFYQLKNFSKEEKYKFNICKKELEKNLKYILISKDANIVLKIKALACKLDIFEMLLKIKQIWKDNI